MSLDSSGQKRDLCLEKVFSILFVEKPPVFSWLVLSQLCKRSAFSSAPNSCPLEMCNSGVFRDVGWRQVPVHYGPPSFDLVSARWMLCLEGVEPSRTGQPQCRGLGGSEKALRNARSGYPCGFLCPGLGHRSVVSLPSWEAAWVELCLACAHLYTSEKAKHLYTSVCGWVSGGWNI